MAFNPLTPLEEEVSYLRNVVESQREELAALWQDKRKQQRFEAAKAAMQGFTALGASMTSQEVAEASVRLADCLLAALEQ